VYVYVWLVPVTVTVLMIRFRRRLRWRREVKARIDAGRASSVGGCGGMYK
jgi:hypothetical protein